MRTLVVGKKPTSFCFHGFRVRSRVRKLKSLDSVARSRYHFKLSYNNGASSLPDPYNLKGWTNIPSSWSDLTFGDLYTYLIETPGIYTKESLKAFKSLEAYHFVISGHVKPLWCHSVGDNIPYCFIKGKVIPSQRINGENDCEESGLISLNQLSICKTKCTFKLPSQIFFSRIHLSHVVSRSRCTSGQSHPIKTCSLHGTTEGYQAHSSETLKMPRICY